MKVLSDRLRQEKDSMKVGYEELIERLKLENADLRKSEEKLLEMTRLKKSLEVELERVSAELQSFRNAGPDDIANELKRMVQQLQNEKSDLRRQLEQHKVQIAELVAQVTTIRETVPSADPNLLSELNALKFKYSQLEADYLQEKNRPVQLPDNPELRRLLEEKIATIQSLQNRIRFLDDELRRKQICTACPEKDVRIDFLTRRVRELELRPTPVKTVEVLPPRREVITRSPERVYTTYTRLPPVRMVAPPVTIAAPPVEIMSTVNVAPPVTRVLRASTCRCMCDRGVYNSCCPLCGQSLSRRVDTEYFPSPVRSNTHLVRESLPIVRQEIAPIQTMHSVRSYSRPLVSTESNNVSYMQGSTSTRVVGPQQTFVSSFPRTPVRYSVKGPSPIVRNQTVQEVRAVSRNISDATNRISSPVQENKIFSSFSNGTVGNSTTAQFRSEETKYSFKGNEQPSFSAPEASKINN